MCTTTDATIQGQDAGAGAGTNGTSTSAMIPRASAWPIVASVLSALALSSAFHVACRTAAASTASMTSGDISIGAV